MKNLLCISILATLSLFPFVCLAQGQSATPWVVNSNSDTWQGDGVGSASPTPYPLTTSSSGVGAANSEVCDTVYSRTWSSPRGLYKTFGLKATVQGTTKAYPGNSHAHVFSEDISIERTSPQNGGYNAFDTQSHATGSATSWYQTIEIDTDVFRGDYATGFLQTY